MNDKDIAAQQVLDTFAACDLTLEELVKARQMLACNDSEPSEINGKLICYEWEAESLIAGGVSPDRLIVIPREVPR
jgi:hypothetical protein